MNFLQLIRETRGRFFAVWFRKRSDGTVRRMIARVGVVKHASGVGLSYDPAEKGLVTAWDCERHQYRSIPVEGVIRLKVCGKTYQKGETGCEVQPTSKR